MKRLFFVALSVLSTFIFPKDIFLMEKTIPYEDYFYSKTYPPYKSTISQEELQQDLNYLYYAFQYAYSGYEQMLYKGFNFQDLRERILHKYPQENIETSQLYISLTEELKPFINDGHFKLLKEEESEDFFQKQSFFFTNTFVNKETGLIEISDENRLIGKKATVNEENLFYYPSKGEGLYRIGNIGANEESIEVIIEEKKITLPLYEESPQSCEGLGSYREIITKNSAYVSIKTFMLPSRSSKYREAYETIFSRYENFGLNNSKKDNLILDLRSNTGGFENYSDSLLYSLYYGFKNLSKEHKIFINKQIGTKERTVKDSPITINARYNFSFAMGHRDEGLINALAFQKQCPTFYQWVRSGKDKITKPKYKGNLIILLDRNTISAAESTVALARKLFKKVYVVGENSCGCLSFADVYTLALPNSGLRMQTPFSRMNYYTLENDFHGEGKGFYPDIWALQQDVVKSIDLIAKDSDLKKKLETIEQML